MGIRWMGQQSSTVLSTVFLSLGLSMEVTGDENGYFSIENIKGAGRSVSLSKEGYYPIDEKPRLHLLMV